MVYIALMTAVLAVLSILRIPLPSGVPITLQTFAVALCGGTLGKRGALAAALYLLLGTLGLPVFSGMSAGASVLFGATGGFLFGFVPMAYLCGTGIGVRGKTARAALGLLGLAICHAMGAMQYALVTNTPLAASFLLVSVPYLIKDIPSVLAAVMLGALIRRRINEPEPSGRARVLL